jgi:hypothetical protein
MRIKKIVRLLTVLLLVFPFVLSAQVTTSSISGIIKNKSGTPLPGASITATHIPTGTIYTSVARTGGRFDINNMNPGGPYTITSTFVGFEISKKEDIFLVLGDILALEFQLSDKSTQLETVVVASVRAGKTGNETQIGRDKLALLPTIGRNLNDFVRFTPQTKIILQGASQLQGKTIVTMVS